MSWYQLVFWVGVVLFCYGGLWGMVDHRPLAIGFYAPWAFIPGLCLLFTAWFGRWIGKRAERRAGEERALRNRERTFRFWLSTFEKGGGQ